MSGRTLTLAVMTHVSADVLALVKAAVVNSLLHAFCSNDVTWSLIRVVEDVGIGHVLGVYASTTLDQRESLVASNGVEILIRV